MGVQHAELVGLAAGPALCLVLRESLAGSGCVIFTLERRLIILYKHSLPAKIEGFMDYIPLIPPLYPVICIYIIIYIYHWGLDLAQPSTDCAQGDYLASRLSHPKSSGRMNMCLAEYADECTQIRRYEIIRTYIQIVYDHLHPFAKIVDWSFVPVVNN